MKNFIIIQPTHVDKRLISSTEKWSNDSFNNLSRLFQARLYHIDHNDIPLDADVYWLINYDVNLIEKEIAFLKKVKEKGAKILVGFSQDWRFLLGQGLVSEQGTIYTELCEVADAIGSGIFNGLGIWGRYQNKVIDMGEIVEDINFSIPYEERTIDFLISGAIIGYTLPFEVELALMVKEKYPDKRIVCCTPDENEVKSKLIEKYGDRIEFATSKILFLEHLKIAKYYCNLELRPRGGRSLIESYYCRVPYISSKWAYHSNLCADFTFDSNNLVDIFNKYEQMINCDYGILVREMEFEAQYDSFENVYGRIVKKLYK